MARGVTVGSIEVVNSTISFNTTQGTYQLVLWTQLPIYNPNYASVSAPLLTHRCQQTKATAGQGLTYACTFCFAPAMWLQVYVSGTINVSFYDQLAGFTVLQPVAIPARAQVHVLMVVTRKGWLNSQQHHRSISLGSHGYQAGTAQQLADALFPSCACMLCPLLQPQFITVDIDSSQVPHKYLL